LKVMDDLPITRSMVICCAHCSQPFSEFGHSWLCLLPWDTLFSGFMWQYTLGYFSPILDSQFPVLSPTPLTLSFGLFYSS
jgi:hypothetical protein